MSPNLLARIFPQTQPPPSKTETNWQRLDPYTSTRLPHPRPAFKIGQRVHVRQYYDATSALQQQCLWIRNWRFDRESGQMRYLLTYTPNGRVYGSEAEEALLAA